MADEKDSKEKKSQSSESKSSKTEHKRSHKSPNTSLIIVLVIIILLIIAGIIIYFVVANNNSSKLSGSQETAAKQQITTNWKKFFNKSTSMSDREKLLQEGAKFYKPMEKEFQSLGSASTSVDISKIDVKSSTMANVTYTVKLNGHPALQDQTGTAIYIDNAWKVSDSTLCQLLKMAGENPSACQGV